MDIFSIVSEPGAPNDWIAAYRPIVWVVQADAAVPADQPMYADIYFGVPTSPMTYYKTLTAYTVMNLCSILLTPGTWCVQGLPYLTSTAAANYASVGVSNSSTTTDDNCFQQTFVNVLTGLTLTSPITLASSMSLATDVSSARLILWPETLNEW